MINIKNHRNTTLQSVITSDAEEAKGSDNIHCDQCDSEHKRFKSTWRSCSQEHFTVVECVYWGSKTR